MTVEVTGVASAQARVAELQARFAGAIASASGGAKTVANGAGQSATASSSNSSSAGSFGASMDRATAIAAANSSPATLEAPFVWNPNEGPGQIELKAGGQQALAEPPPVVAAPPAATPPASSSAPSRSVDEVAPVAPVAGPSAPTAVDSVSGTSRIDRLIATSKKYLGVPYLWGGTNPNVGLDCSGFTQLVFRQHGVNLPRVARDQQKVGERIGSMADAKPGDLLFFGQPATHVTMYLGDNKMIHAPRRGRTVSIDNVYRTPTTIRRYIPSGGEANPAATAPVRTAATPPSATQTSANAAQAAAALQAVQNAQFASASAVLGNTGSPLGGWAGATPAPDTWGAAVAAAQAQGMDGLVPPAGAVATPAVAAMSGVNPAVSATPAVAGAGPLSKAPAYLQTMFQEAERKYGVSAHLLAAVAKQESNFKLRAVSHAGARGLMQLMPGTARGLGVRDSFNPEQAIDGAARLLRDHLRTFRSTELALAAYNAGPGAVRRFNGIPPYAETQNYVRRIMANMSSAGVTA